MTYRADEIVTIAGSDMILCASSSLVRLYDSADQRVLSEFETSHSPGGRRLALSTSADFAVVGSYYEGGVTCYETNSGAVLWSRKELKKPQSLRLSSDDKLVYCGFDRGPAQILSAATGNQQDALRGVSRVWPLSSEVRIDVKKRSFVLMLISGKTRSFPLAGFAVLDSVLANGVIWVSEATGPVRAFDSTNGSELWRYQPGQDSHVLQLSVSAAGDCYGVEWCYEVGGPHKVIRFDVGASDQTDEKSLQFRFELMSGLDAAIQATLERTPLDVGESYQR